MLNNKVFIIIIIYYFGYFIKILTMIFKSLYNKYLIFKIKNVKFYYFFML